MGAGLSIAASGARAAGRERLGPRNGHSASLDLGNRAVLVYGGADTGRVLGDLWSLSPAGDARLLANGGPPARTFAAMSHDARRGRTLVFGGNRHLFGPGGDHLLDDHWEWDGRRWSPFEGARPPSRAEAACVYDPGRGSTLLFGGYRFVGGERVRLNDCWEFDGAAWRQLEPAAPSPRSGAAMVHDPGRKAAVLIGGSGGALDCWEFGASGWRRIADLPAPRFNPAACHVAHERRILVFGGFRAGARLAETCALGASGWERIGGHEPPARNHAVLVDTGAQGALLIGGHDGDRVFGDLWRWDDAAWNALVDDPPALRIDNGH